MPSRKRPSNTAQPHWKKSVTITDQDRKWAQGVMQRCNDRLIGVNHPDVKKALAIVTGISENGSRQGDAMHRCVPGSYGSRS